MSLIQSFLWPTTLVQWGVLFVSCALVFIGFQLLPFKWRKQIGLIQVLVLFAITYMLFVGGQYLLPHTEGDREEKIAKPLQAPKAVHWVAMQVKVKALNLRRCKTTYCESIALLPIGTKVMVDLHSNDNNWLSATVDGNSGYVSSIYLERAE